MMEKIISNFPTSFCIPSIQKLAFQIPHVQILRTNHYGDSCQTVFKRLESFQDVLYFHYYAVRVVDSFAN